MTIDQRVVRRLLTSAINRDLDNETLWAELRRKFPDADDEALRDIVSLVAYEMLGEIDRGDYRMDAVQRIAVDIQKTSADMAALLKDFERAVDWHPQWHRKAEGGYCVERSCALKDPAMLVQAYRKRNGGDPSLLSVPIYRRPTA